MFFRCLMLTLSVALVAAHEAGSMESRHLQQKLFGNKLESHYHHRPHFRPPHHPRHHHAPKMVALDELVKHRHAQYFLGKEFLAKALLSQPSDRKYLTITGKEERDVNGTISLNKKNMQLHLTENKDGHFLVTDRKSNVVGSVDMHSYQLSNAEAHKKSNGETVIYGNKVGNANVEVERDVMMPHRRLENGSFSSVSAPVKRHMKAHVSQVHHTNGFVRFSPPQPAFSIEKPLATPEMENEHRHYRFRRQVDPKASSLDAPCAEGDLACQNKASQANNKPPGFFKNISENISKIGKTIGRSVCKSILRQDDPNATNANENSNGSPDKEFFGKPVNPNDPTNKGNFLSNIGKAIKGAVTSSCQSLNASPSIIPNESLPNQNINPQDVQTPRPDEKMIINDN